MNENSYCKLEIFIPETHLPALQKALQEADAGHIGRYDCCLSHSPVTVCRPGPEGELCLEPERKVEVTCRTGQVERVMAAVRSIHPSDNPLIYAIPLYRTSF